MPAWDEANACEGNRYVMSRLLVGALPSLPALTASALYLGTVAKESKVLFSKGPATQRGGIAKLYHLPLPWL